MDLKAFYLQGLSEVQRARFVEIAETSDNYMRVHLVKRGRVPRPDLMSRLLKACQTFDSSVTREQLLDFFYPPEPAELPATQEAA